MVGEAVVAVLLEGMPVSEVARRMGTNHNALYKLLHDARTKLKRHMEAAGLPPQEVLAAFEGGKIRRARRVQRLEAREAFRDAQAW